jgi:hypothetical protein
MLKIIGVFIYITLILLFWIILFLRSNIQNKILKKSITLEKHKKSNYGSIKYYNILFKPFVKKRKLKLVYKFIKDEPLNVQKLYKKHKMLNLLSLFCIFAIISFSYFAHILFK